MPREATITLYVKPYIRRFVQAKLADPQGALHDATARELWLQLQRALQLPVVGVAPDGLDDTHPVWQVSLRTSEDLPDEKLDPDRYHRDLANAVLNKAYYNDMFQAVKYSLGVLDINIPEALSQHRARYGVTEEDYKLEHAVRLYQKHHRRHRNRQRKAYGMTAAEMPPEKAVHLYLFHNINV